MVPWGCKARLGYTERPVAGDRGAQRGAVQSLDAGGHKQRSRPAGPRNSRSFPIARRSHPGQANAVEQKLEFAQRPKSTPVFYMGKNTPERESYIMVKLVVPTEV